MSRPAGSPDGPTTAEQMLAAARAGLRRLGPHEAHAAMRAGALFVDIRADSRRERDGVIPGARFVPRNVLEWRMDPACPHRDPALARRDVQIVVVCEEGYQSSLVAATLQRLGLERATDLAGGFLAWRAAGLPVDSLTQGVPMRAIDCPCGHRLEGADDDELVRLAREHIERDHPGMQRTDEQLHERVAADAYDVVEAAR